MKETYRTKQNKTEKQIATLPTKILQKHIQAIMGPNFFSTSLYLSYLFIYLFIFSHFLQYFTHLIHSPNYDSIVVAATGAEQVFVFMPHTCTHRYQETL